MLIPGKRHVSGVLFRGLSLKQPEQILPREQGGILGAFKKRPDILAERLHVDREQPAPHLLHSSSGIDTIGSFCLIEGCLIEGVLQERQVRRDRRPLRQIPHKIVPIAAFGIAAGQ